MLLSSCLIQFEVMFNILKFIKKSFSGDLWRVYLSEIAILNELVKMTLAVLGLAFVFLLTLNKQKYILSCVSSSQNCLVLCVRDQ